MKLDVRISQGGGTKKLADMKDRAVMVRGWLNRFAYPIVIEAQRLRWVSEGTSEGSQWKALNQTYAVRKLKKFASYPGSGRKMLIATGSLVDSVTGDNTQNHYKIVSDLQLQTGSMVGYAKYVNEERNFTNLGPTTIDNLRTSLLQYLMGK